MGPCLWERLQGRVLWSREGRSRVKMPATAVATPKGQNMAAPGHRDLVA